jgi:hypothetical protein
MNDTQEKGFFSSCFPRRRFDVDFPMVVWFVGLWFYLKSFLYLCYFYGLGLEPSPFSPDLIAETIYFGATFIPVFLMAHSLWNEKGWARTAAFFFLIIDTPMLYAHVRRLGMEGYLESGLTVVLEYGSLGLNLLSIGG